MATDTNDHQFNEEDSVAETSNADATEKEKSDAERSAEVPSSSTAGFAYWREKLRSAKYVIAPMVDQSELAWRMMARQHGAELCYTPMFHAHLFATDAVYRRNNLVTCAEDRPLIVQFCANDPVTLVRACLLAAPHCDGVDLNLGCPQMIAKKGHYGAFLQDEWELIYQMVNEVYRRCPVPISCKIRVFEDVEKTIRYAKMLESAGCQLLTVHGRTREQKGVTTGFADWSLIRAVKQAVNIPVFANGNIQFFEDVDRCLRETGVDGIMTAEGSLSNPYIFNGRHEPSWVAGAEYLDFVEKYPCPSSYARAHMFKIFHHSMVVFADLRERLAKVYSVAEFRQIGEAVKERCIEDHERYLRDPESVDTAGLLFPHWICQPYVRPLPTTNGSAEAAVNSTSKEQIELRQRKRQHLEQVMELTGMSKRRIRRLERRGVPITAPKKTPVTYADKCACGNPIAQKCELQRCRRCCRDRAARERLNCFAHHFNFAEKSPKWTQSLPATSVAS
uniref:tRNA-dihydrouridine(16/17) synthase [NAD(P)(+)] n=1 Tax=Plectus sambesii TaxID=2011161 RepID=A0A914X0A1_9BILA